MARLVVNSNSLSFDQISSSNNYFNENSVMCKNEQPTDAHHKCSLLSTLSSFKSIKSISIYSFGFLSDDWTSVYLYVDNDITIPGSYLPKNTDRTVHIEGNVFYVSDSNSNIIEQNLESTFVPNNNKVELLIPPSSCFNLKLKEIITSVVIPFSASAYLTSDSGMVSQTQVSGEITANIVSMDYSESTPCN